MMRRSIGCLALLAALLGPLGPDPVRAQGPSAATTNTAGFPATEPPPDQGPQGNPLYGYLGWGFLACIAIFAVCKSARR